MDLSGSMREGLFGPRGHSMGPPRIPSPRKIITRVDHDHKGWQTEFDINKEHLLELHFVLCSVLIGYQSPWEFKCETFSSSEPHRSRS